MTIETQLKTEGDYVEESQSLADFDAIIEAGNAFRLYREVPGEYIHPRIGTLEHGRDKGAAVDRVLIPLEPALNAGWNWGAIAVEGKKSGNKLGPMATQALDYHRCAWRLETGSLRHLEILTRWLFLFPASFPLGVAGSILANNRIGCCRVPINNYLKDTLVFTCAGTTGIKVGPGNFIEVHPLNMGNKRGSR